jgi:hypothetical protein
MSKLTVADVRRAIDGLPDTTRVYPDWADGRVPNDDDPGVEVLDIESRQLPGGEPYLAIRVGLFYLDDDADWVEETTDETVPGASGSD